SADRGSASFRREVQPGGRGRDRQNRAGSRARATMHRALPSRVHAVGLMQEIDQPSRLDITSPPRFPGPRGCPKDKRMRSERATGGDERQVDRRLTGEGQPTCPEARVGGPIRTRRRRPGHGSNFGSSFHRGPRSRNSAIFSITIFGLVAPAATNFVSKLVVRPYRLIYRTAATPCSCWPSSMAAASWRTCCSTGWFGAPEAPRAVAPLESELHPARRDLVGRRPFPPGRMLSLHVPE